MSFRNIEINKKLWLKLSQTKFVLDGFGYNISILCGKIKSTKIPGTV